MVVPRGGEQSEDILAFVLGVFEEGDSGEVGEEDFVAEFVFVGVFVDGEGIRSED